MSGDRHEYWFPAKTLGYGWGLPTRWQGWVVLTVYVLALIAAFVRFPPQTHAGPFAAVVLLASALLVLVCALKGEPPRWRWRR